MALLHAGDAEYVAGVVEFLRPGLDAGEPIALALPAQVATKIRARIGAPAGLVLLDAHEVAHNPARIIPAILTMVEEQSGRRLHYVGDFMWPGRSPEEIEETLRHEALTNLAWPDAALRALCVYDTRTLHPAVIRDVCATHPWHMRGRTVLRSPSYGGPVFPAGTDNPLPDPPDGALTIVFGIDDLAAMRAAVNGFAQRAALAPDARNDLVIAVNEVATNAIKYAPDDGVLRVWSSGAALICQLEDRGHIGDPLAGRHRPAPGVQGGVGLWMVNQLCDLVQTRTTPAGTTIRLHARMR